MDSEGFADIGSIQARIDGQTEFPRRAGYREACKKAFIHADSSKRVATGLLRKAAPLLGTYKVGDIVAFQRKQDAATEETRWHPGSRTIGFDGKGTYWMTYRGEPFCDVLGHIRPIRRMWVDFVLTRPPPI